jgi:hypothetical protein
MGKYLVGMVELIPDRDVRCYDKSYKHQHDQRHELTPLPADLPYSPLAASA